MDLRADVVKVGRYFQHGIETRRSRRRARALLTSRPPIPDGWARVAVYFPDEPENLYQVDQWYEPLRRLSEQHPVVVLTRTWQTTLRMLEDCPVPVFHAPDIDAAERFLDHQQVRAVLYVNQNMKNFSAMRFATPAHVFICHGESDKDYMSSNQLKAYDTVFVAGQAARERILTKLVGFDEFRLVEVGRPQVDVTYSGPDLPEDDRTVVLFAPTFEGDRATMRYSSVVSHGVPLVRSLLATGRHRVVYRPHPRIGTVLEEHARAHREIVGLLEAANDADGAAGHVVDTEGGFGWQLQAADVAVMDISAVAYDWLATAKPLIVTRPAEPLAQPPTVGLVTEVDLLDAGDAPRAAELVDAAVAVGSETHAALVERYFGDTTPGASMQRFLDACDAVVRERDRALAGRA